MTTIKVTVSGSFRRHLLPIQEAVNELTAAGAKVLSPSSPVVVDQIEQFVFVASDVHRSPRLVQDRHLAAVSQSDFLWLICPDGYVGQSAALEVGYAISRGTPIFVERLPDDLTLRQYVGKVENCMQAVKIAKQLQRTKEEQESLLLDPIAAIAAAHEAVDRLSHLLLTPVNIQQSVDLDRRVDKEQKTIYRLLSNHGH